MALDPAQVLETIQNGFVVFPVCLGSTPSRSAKHSLSGPVDLHAQGFHEDSQPFFSRGYHRRCDRPNPRTMPPGIEGANVFLRSGSLANTTVEEHGMRLERSDADTIIPDTEPSGFLAISFFTYNNTMMEKYPVEAIENAIAGIWEHGDQIKERYCKQHKCQEFLACNPEPFLLFPSQCDDPDDDDKTLDWCRCTHWNNPRPVECQAGRDILKHVSRVVKKGYHDELGGCYPVELRPSWYFDE
ncbi:hypothetical protein LOZ57_006154 [Ophidiomyces ophidiicola]|uniref:uncharacterized protein n=1 Tax=Ophidiomyces ophidiicola TaxID=1387563 RepID=UPI0020C28B71|nr:uncharacterized protein LOZ57_006154 [Ophidiomyces ophidiicola]KAI1939194.1 hypothetical protein LOZ57_006154 [Ophidiomyces ophidiicola]